MVVVGFRSGLCAALGRLGIEFALWSPGRRAKSGASALHVAPLGRAPGEVEAAAEHLAPHGPFSHVIAATEAGVVPAARLRRRLGARRFPIRRVLRCHDKLEMKRHLAGQGIPMTEFRGSFGNVTPEELLAAWGLPIVVKPRTSSGSRGIAFAHDAETLRRARRHGYVYERFVDAEEASVESFVHRGEIAFTNLTRYLAKGHVNVVPAGFDRELEGALLALNRRVIAALGIEWGMTHLEAFLTADGPLFGEIALRPPGGHIMELLDLAYGGDAWANFAAVEMDRDADFPGHARSACAAIVLHPGAGTVRSVRGLEEIRRHPFVVDASLRVAAGDAVAPRAGFGQSVGRVLLRAPDHARLLAAVETVERELVIEVCGGGRSRARLDGPLGSS